MGENVGRRVASFSVEPEALRRIDQIIDYTRRQWGEQQAELYIQNMFDCFAAIAAHQVLWRPIPSVFGIKGFVHRYRHHYVYWQALPGDTIAIFSILHERMDQSSVLGSDLEA